MGSVKVIYTKKYCQSKVTLPLRMPYLKDVKHLIEFVNHRFSSGKFFNLNIRNML